MNRKIFLPLGVITILLAVVVGFFYAKMEPATEPVAGVVDVSPINVGDRMGATDENLEYTIEVLPPELAVDANPPELDRKVNFSTADDGSKLAIANISESLKTDKANLALWIDLGSWRNIIEDYEGAREAWEYATKLAPSASVAFGNLGFLYGYYLHDTVKAEQNFKIAIKNSPQDLFLYQQTFEFYRDVLKDNVKARALAEEGKRITGNTAYFDQLLNTLQ